MFRRPIETLLVEDKPQKAILEKAGCLQSTVSKHIHGKLTGREEFVRKKKERLWEDSQTKTNWELGGASQELYQDLHYRHFQKMSYNCHMLSISHSWTNHQKHVKRIKEKKNWTVAQWSNILIYMKVNFAFNLEIKVP